MMRSFLLLFMLLLTIDASADNTSFWRNADQQGEALLQQGDASAAAEVFTDPRRKAYANIQAGKYREAAADLANFQDSESNYNRGNALAYEGDLQAALDAYDAALKDNPNHTDARHNRELVARALEQQSSQQSDSSDEQQNDESRDKQQNNKDQDKQDQNQQDQNQQSQDSSGSGQDEQNGKGNQDKQAQSGQEESDQDERQDSEQDSANEKQEQGAQGGQSSSEKSDTEKPDAEKPDADQAGSEQNKPSQGQDKQTSQAELDKQKNDKGQHEQESAASKQAQQEKVPDQTGKRQPTSAADDAEQARRDAEASLALSGKQDKTGSDKGDKDIQADEPLSEKQLALDQWLRNIPDDPGGLLRRKFLIEHMMRQQNLRP